MGWLKDIAEVTGLIVDKRTPLDQLGKTGIDCLDRWIDEGVRTDMALEEAQRAFKESEKKRR